MFEIRSDKKRNDSNANLDESKINSFLEKVFDDITGAYTTLLCSMGDKLDLFKKLESRSPLTSIELAKIADVNERYVREWLYAMASAGYVIYNIETQKFNLPDEHSPILTQEGGPIFLAGIYQQFLAEIKEY